MLCNEVQFSKFEKYLEKFAHCKLFRSWKHVTAQAVVQYRIKRLFLKILTLFFCGRLHNKHRFLLWISYIPEQGSLNSSSLKALVNILKSSNYFKANPYTQSHTFTPFFFVSQLNDLLTMLTDNTFYVQPYRQQLLDLNGGIAVVHIFHFEHLQLGQDKRDRYIFHFF